MEAGTEAGGVDPSRFTVSSIMSKGVRVVPPELTVDSLMQLFIDENLSRVLVVDRDQKPVGVVSKTDILLRRHLRGETEETNAPRAVLKRGITLPLDWGFHDTGEDETVADIMSPGVVSVPDDAPITEACRMMVRSMVHGLPVISPDRGPIGWVSAMDVVGWISGLSS